MTPALFSKIIQTTKDLAYLLSPPHHICMHILLFHIFTSRHTFIECVMLKHELRTQNSIYVKEKCQVAAFNLNDIPLELTPKIVLQPLPQQRRLDFVTPLPAIFTCITPSHW